MDSWRIGRLPLQIYLQEEFPMTTAHGSEHAAPFWFTSPGGGDSLAWVALGGLILALYGLVVLYASFDRWAEQRAHGTPLAKTIPTLLTIAARSAPILRMLAENKNNGKTLVNKVIRKI